MKHVCMLCGSSVIITYYIVLCRLWFYSILSEWHAVWVGTFYTAHSHAYNKWSPPHNTFTLFIWSAGWANSITGQKMSVCQPVCESVCVYVVNQGDTIITTTRAHLWSCIGIRTFLPWSYFSVPWQYSPTFLGFISFKEILPREFPPHTNPCPWLCIEQRSICNRICCKFFQKTRILCRPALA